ncbi:MAG: hypothetical protein ACFFCP_12620 [Promethearchaeota archaeon]
MKNSRTRLFLNVLVVCTLMFTMLQPYRVSKDNVVANSGISAVHHGRDFTLSDNGELSFFDYFNSSLGYNDSLWNLESYGNGSVSWVDGEFFNMSAKTHSYRTLSSKQMFSAGHEMTLRMKMEEAETVVCVGWTNKTAETGWNYLFEGNSVYIEGAQSTLLLTQRNEADPERTFKQLQGVDATEFHDYRVVWNSSVIIAYVDGVRLGAIGGTMPEGPLHVKLVITEVRNMATEGWVCLDSIEIREHHSMITENPPFITLNSPGNMTLNLGGDLIEVIPIGSNGTLFWSWDNTPNKTSNAQYDIRLPAEEGIHSLDVYCKDGYGYNNWDHERYYFKTMVAPPTSDAVWVASPPAIDGILQNGEWPTNTFQEFNLARADGSTVAVEISLLCDSLFFYVGIDSPVPSGHDSRAAVITTGNPDGHYHGSNETPVVSAYYTMGSPQAWEGYTELKYLGETEGVVIEKKIEIVPSGFLASSSEHGSHVHYEFRFPLGELDVNPGSVLGVSFMLFPTGMGVHNLFYPIAYPWENASKLALVWLPLAPDTSLTELGIVGVLGFVAVALIIGYRRKVSITPRIETTSVPPILDSERIDRMIGIIQSYDKIPISRLSMMINMREDETRQVVKELIAQHKLSAELRDNIVIRRS